MASKPATKPLPARKPKLSLVKPSTALQQADTAIAEAAKQSAPMTSRITVVRNECIARANELGREREGYEERKALLEQQYQAAMAGLDENIADIDGALAVLNGGISTAEAGRAAE